MTGSASGGEEARRLKSTLFERPREFRWREVAFGRLFAAAGPCTGSNRPEADICHKLFSERNAKYTSRMNDERPKR